MWGGMFNFGGNIFNPPPPRFNTGEFVYCGAANRLNTFRIAQSSYSHMTRNYVYQLIDENGRNVKEAYESTLMARGRPQSWKPLKFNKGNMFICDNRVFLVLDKHISMSREPGLHRSQKKKS